MGDGDGRDVGHFEDRAQLVVVRVGGGPHGGGALGEHEQHLAVLPDGAFLRHHRVGRGLFEARQEQYRGACTLYESSCALGC
ncbi:hypothetical protein GCM10023082_30150 [Streptomyces tremellae]|uniref:Uncharacterized protein n=1 Tax=Streptomyces tremellae TaxID=1124239 RepID=A0ABP7F685_9ACTN